MRALPLLLLLLALPAGAQTLTGGATTSKVTVGAENKRALDVRCVSGCTGGGGGAGGTVAISQTGTENDVNVSGTVSVTGPLTDTQLRATPVPVSGTVGVSGTVPVSGTFWQATQPVSLASVPSHAVTGPLTNTELRASAVPVSLTSTTITGSVSVTEAGVGAAGATAPTSAELAGARAVADGASPTARTAGQQADNISTLDGRLYVETRHPRWFACYLLTTATTATILNAGPSCPGTLTGSDKYHVKSVSLSGSAASTTTANEQLALLYGTGGTCGTGTQVVFSCFGPANGGCNTPADFYVQSVAAAQLCVRAAMAGSKIVHVTGYIAP